MIYTKVCSVYNKIGKLATKADYNKSKKQKENFAMKRNVRLFSLLLALMCVVSMLPAMVVSAETRIG